MYAWSILLWWYSYDKVIPEHPLMATVIDQIIGDIVTKQECEAL